MNYRVDIKQLKKAFWYREGGAMAPFYIHIPYLGQLKGLDYGVFYVRKFVGYAYYDKQIMEQKTRKVFNKQIENKEYIDELRKPWVRARDKQNQFFITLEKINFKHLSNQRLLSLHQKFIKSRENLWGQTQYLLEAFNEYDLPLLNELQEKLGQKLNLHEIKVLTTPVTPTFTSRARRDFLDLYRKFQKKSKDFDQALNQYIRRWFWLCNNWAFIHDLNKEYFLKQLHTIDEQKLIREIKEEENYLAEIRSEQIKITKNRKLLPQLINFFYLLRQLGTWREERKQQTLTENGWADRFLKEFSCRTKIKHAVLKCASPYLLKDTFKISKGLIVDLKTSESLIIGKNFKNWKIFYGSQAKEIGVVIEQTLVAKDKKIIEGKVANPGKVKGAVKLVFTYKDFNKVNLGDVLVTQMTRPEFVPVLKKVRAIITDEGGITCHAAIVSRELNKPCIIGTKVATKALKDGQLVEVDANKGIVRII